LSPCWGVGARHRGGGGGGISSRGGGTSVVSLWGKCVVVLSLRGKHGWGKDTEWRRRTGAWNLKE